MTTPPKKTSPLEVTCPDGAVRCVYELTAAEAAEAEAEAASAVREPRLSGSAMAMLRKAHERSSPGDGYRISGSGMHVTACALERRGYVRVARPSYPEKARVHITAQGRAALLAENGRRDSKTPPGMVLLECEECERDYEAHPAEMPPHRCAPCEEGMHDGEH